MSSRPRALSGRPLTPKQLRFVEEYLCDLNAGAAYLRAGYAVRNSNVARVNASRLLTNANIQAARQQLSERTHVDQDMVIQGLYTEATYAGEDATHSARVSAWGHLARYFLPVPKAEEGPKERKIQLVVVYEDRDGRTRSGVKAEVE